LVSKTPSGAAQKIIPPPLPCCVFQHETSDNNRGEGRAESDTKECVTTDADASWEGRVKTQTVFNIASTLGTTYG
jgi:hypothetical protein